jgi:hypothetical protein
MTDADISRLSAQDTPGIVNPDVRNEEHMWRASDGEGDEAEVRDRIADLLPVASSFPTTQPTTIAPSRRRSPNWFGYLGAVPEIRARIRALLADSSLSFEEAQEHAIREFLETQGSRIGVDRSTLDEFLSRLDHRKHAR